MEIDDDLDAVFLTEVENAGNDLVDVAPDVHPVESRVFRGRAADVDLEPHQIDIPLFQLGKIFLLVGPAAGTHHAPVDRAVAYCVGVLADQVRILLLGDDPDLQGRKIVGDPPGRLREHHIDRGRPRISRDRMTEDQLFVKAARKIVAFGIIPFLVRSLVFQHELDSHVVKLRLRDIFRLGADRQRDFTVPIRRQVDGEGAARGALVRLLRGNDAGEHPIREGGAAPESDHLLRRLDLRPFGEGVRDDFGKHRLRNGFLRFRRGDNPDFQRGKIIGDFPGRLGEHHIDGPFSRVVRHLVRKGKFLVEAARKIIAFGIIPLLIRPLILQHEFDSHVGELRLGDLLRFGADGKLHPLPPVRRQVDGETAARGTLVRLFRGDGAGEFLIVPLVIPVTEELAFFHFDWAPVRLRVRGGGKERDASQKQCNGKCFFHLLTYFCEKSAFPFLENAFSRTSFDGVAGSALRSSTALPEYSTSHIFASRNA